MIADLDENSSVTQSILMRKREINMSEMRRLGKKSFFQSKRVLFEKEEQERVADCSNSYLTQEKEVYMSKLAESIKFAIERQDGFQVKKKTVGELLLFLRLGKYQAAKLALSSHVYKDLIKLLTEEYDMAQGLQEDVCECFINMALCDASDLEVLVEYEVFEFFFFQLERFHRQGNIKMTNHILFFFANATGSRSSLKIKNLLISKDITVLLLKILLGKLEDEILKTIIFLILNLADHTHNVPKINKELRNLIPCLLAIFSEPFEKIITHLTLRSLKCILGDFSGTTNTAFENKVDDFLSGGFCESVVRMIFEGFFVKNMEDQSDEENTDQLMFFDLLYIINSLTFGNEIQTKELINKGILKALFHLLQECSNSHHRMYVARSIGNFACIDAEHSEEFFQKFSLEEEPYIDTIINHIKLDNYEVRLEFLFCLTSLVHSCTEPPHSRTEAQLKNLLERDIIGMFVNELTLENEEGILVEIIGASAILIKFGSGYLVDQPNSVMLEFQRQGGHIKIEGLQTHKSYNVFRSCETFIETFYHAE